MDHNDYGELRKTLRILEREIEKVIEDQSGCCGVSFAQCHTLLEIEEIGEVSIKALSERLELDNSTLSRTIDKMVKDGLIHRTENPSDRRYLMLSLTDNGKKTANSIGLMCNGYYRELFENIPVEKHNQIIDSIGILASSMKKMRKKSSNSKNCCK
ncbi:MAG: hypothetical protein A2Y33_01085 [Spirochaetes bacterium GWF1_51_8]|nr:MAG: hypothetical protein A2Y33_01085 [Spirochaetes bacterium GWF1_51_8]